MQKEIAGICRKRRVTLHASCCACMHLRTGLMPLILAPGDAACWLACKDDVCVCVRARACGVCVCVCLHACVWCVCFLLADLLMLCAPFCAQLLQEHALREAQEGVVRGQEAVERDELQALGARDAARRGARSAALAQARGAS